MNTIMDLKSKVLFCVLLFLSVGASGQSYSVPCVGTSTQTLGTPGTYKIYDSGGPTGDYSNNCNGTLVLNVPIGTTISGIYNTESSYDKLNVYDGETLLKSCTGIGSLSATVITSGIIRLVFSSDGSITSSGFELDVVVTSTICTDLNVMVNSITDRSAKIIWTDISPVSGYDITVTNMQTGTPTTYNGVTSPLDIAVFGSTNYTVTVSKGGCSARSSFQTLATSPWKEDDLVIPFCTEDNEYGITYPAGTTNENVLFPNGTGNIGCLGSTPSPAWFIFRIDHPGNMVIEMTHSNRRDIDFICWGPFSGTSKQNVLAQVNAGLPGTLAPHSTGDRCSYSTDWRETCTISNAQQGEWYVLLITNYSQQTGDISFNKISGDATTTCDIIIDVSSNSPICEGENLNLYVNNAPAGATFQWTGPNGFTSTSPTPVIPNATLAGAGAYSVVMTASGQVADPRLLTVEINPKYVVYDTISIENGQSYLFGSQFLMTAGDYQHHFFSRTGCDSLVYLHLRYNIVIDIASNGPVCEGGNLNLYVNNAPAGAVFQWTGPNGFTSTSATPVIPGATLAHAGTYSVAATVGTQIIDPVSSTVTINPRYTVRDTVFIKNGQSYFFGTQFLTTTGNYQHHFNSRAGCDSLVYLYLIVIDISSNSPICEGGNLNLYVNGAPSGATFQWTGPNGFTSTSATPVVPNAALAYAGVYSMVMTVGGRTAAPVLLTVRINPRYENYATAFIESGQSYLFGTQLLTTAGDYQHLFTSIAGCDSLVHLHLSCITRGTDFATICANALPFVHGSTTFYSAGVQDIYYPSGGVNGCDSIVTFTLNVIDRGPGITFLDPAPVVCEGTPVVLNAVATPAEATIDWFDPDTVMLGTGNTITVNPVFDALLTDENNHRAKYIYRVVATYCDYETEETVTVYVDEPLEDRPLEILTVCKGSRATLDASSYDATTYLWESETDPAEQRVGATWRVTPAIATFYKVEMTRGLCSGEGRFLVEIASLPEILSIDSIGALDRRIILNESSGTPPFYYGVDSEYLNEYAEKYGLRLGPHTFRVVDDLGCKSEIMSYTLIAPPLIIPPFFSPNGDDVNDNWEVISLRDYYPDAIVKVFDRFGKKLVEYKATDAGWDGTYLGKAMPATDYWFVISSRDLEKELVGHFALLR